MFASIAQSIVDLPEVMGELVLRQRITIDTDTLICGHQVGGTIETGFCTIMPQYRFSQRTG